MELHNTGGVLLVTQGVDLVTHLVTDLVTKGGIVTKFGKFVTIYLARVFLIKGG